ncbi:putative protease SohB [BD1-7 clade bacterium]|uniref:Putative protease SohB n=1 Tax=BD1-7 clade bacterium TaxID=2029982 RepID=A0A5S9QT04_9GAMM|nr:putative protease SohB [BD1-7 clade bacterium]CAA0122442.1 putative protease SohB [BD1-7 clade bacterium]
MEFLAEYGLFLLKAVTIVVSIIVVFGAFIAIGSRSKGGGLHSGHVDVKKLNEKFEDYERELRSATMSEKSYKAFEKEVRKSKKATDKADSDLPRIYVIDFEGDVQASAVDNLTETVSAVLTLATPKDEVVMNVESPGGMVHTYGLAASQLDRIREKNIPLTVCVDKVAASGGYLMACVADKILAAPFAIIGSIGVLAQIPNFNRVLKKYDVDYEVMTAGEHKAPITMFGEITDKGRDKLKEDLEDTHVLFKEFIAKHRPNVDLDEVATGEVWYGTRALAHNLVDEVVTSDSYLMKQAASKEIFHIEFVEKKSLQEKLGMQIAHVISTVVGQVASRSSRHQIK